MSGKKSREGETGEQSYHWITLLRTLGQVNGWKRWKAEMKRQKEAILWVNICAEQREEMNSHSLLPIVDLQRTRMDPKGSSEGKRRNGRG
jgi:hypothetical protein